MRVALLTAKPNRDRTVGGYRFSVAEKRPPHGIGFLYAVLREAGIEVDVFDRYCGDKRWPADHFASYDFLGLYTASICTTDIHRILRKVRAKRIAVGGPHAHLFDDQIPEHVDHIVKGEAEAIIVDLVQGRISQRIVKPPRLTSEELDALPRFPWELFYQRHRALYDWTYVFHPASPMFCMNTSRGCPFNCAFCSVRRLWGTKITAMSSARIIEDIRYLLTLGAQAIYFREDIFTASRRRLIAFCEALIRQGIHIHWACESRVDRVDQDTLSLMKRAGCVGLYVGVEHLSQPMLDRLNKNITVSQIQAFFEDTRRLGLFTHASFIVDHPDETVEDRREQQRMLEIIRPDHATFNSYRADG